MKVSIIDSYLKTITVNDLNTILRKYFKCKKTFIESIEVASFSNQYHPLKHLVGAAGILNITFSTSKKLK